MICGRLRDCECVCIYMYVHELCTCCVMYDVIVHMCECECGCMFAVEPLYCGHPWESLKCPDLGPTQRHVLTLGRPLGKGSTVYTVHVTCV